MFSPSLAWSRWLGGMSSRESDLGFVAITVSGDPVAWIQLSLIGGFSVSKSSRLVALLCAVPSTTRGCSERSSVLCV